MLHETRANGHDDQQGGWWNFECACTLQAIRGRVSASPAVWPGGKVVKFTVATELIYNIIFPLVES